MADRCIDGAAAPDAAAAGAESGLASDPRTPLNDALPDGSCAEDSWADPGADEPASAGATLERADGAALPDTGPEAASEGGGTGPDAFLEAVRRLETHVSAETGKLLEAFREKLAFDGFKEAQVERLHAELQEHRDGLLERATRPLLNAVIRVHDDLGKVVASLRARPPEEITPERAFRALNGFRDDLELLLSQHGVEPFEPVDDVFDPRMHTALRTVHTADPERAGRIAERLRPGFSQGDALLQRARVAVFTAQGAPPPPSHTTIQPTPTGEER